MTDRPEPLAAGFGLVESPRWHDGRLWFADWIAGAIHVVDDDGAVDVAVRHDSLPLCFDFQPDGTMLVVSSAQCALLRLGDDGELAVRCDLTPLSGLGANDIVVDGRGNVYVNSHDAQMGTVAAAGQKATGRVFLVPDDGSPRLVADDLDFPNGMAVTGDNRTLIVAESYRHRLTAFTIAADGELTDRRTFADLGDVPPDGISIDADGAVWVAEVPGRRCLRVAEGGAVLDEIAFDRGAFACVLGGQRGDRLFTVGAHWPGPTGFAQFTGWDGSVWSSAAPAARSGWPGN